MLGECTLYCEKLLLRVVLLGSVDMLKKLPGSVSGTLCAAAGVEVCLAVRGCRQVCLR